jgi:murein DD-endopeptidase MepM/ murein hydrolase activator NlpD
VKLTLVIPVLLFGLLLTARAGGAASQYPVIRVLSGDDALFVQQQTALEEFRRVSEIKGAVVLPPVDFFEYTKRDSEDLFSLNARLGLRYDTLATLNGTVGKAAFSAKTRILIPSQEGLFLNNPPQGDLEDMILSTRVADGKKPQSLVVSRDGKAFAAYFFPGEAFSPMERSYFLGILFRLPIDKPRITSMYGWRKDPFTGNPEFHAGIDFGAAEGTEVYAARDGIVEETGYDGALGKFVVITHPGGYQTVYGHLSSISVTMNQKVSTGAIIGIVGSTGRATGPHLHFEMRTKAGTKDPYQLLAMKKN